MAKKIKKRPFSVLRETLGKNKKGGPLNITFPWRDIDRIVQLSHSLGRMAQLSHNLRRIVQPSHNLGRIVQLSHNLGRIVQLTCHPEKDRFQHILKNRWCNLPMIPKRRCCFSSPLLTYFERIVHCSYSHEKGTVEFKSPRHTLANYCHQIMTLSKKIYILFSLYTTSMEVVSNSSNKIFFLFFTPPQNQLCKSHKSNKAMTGRQNHI